MRGNGRERVEESGERSDRASQLVDDDLSRSRSLIPSAPRSATRHAAAAARRDVVGVGERRLDVPLVAGSPDVPESDERIPAEPARVVLRDVQPLELLDQLRAVAREPVGERDERLASSPGCSPARRFSTPRFHGHTSWQMSQP